MTKEIPVKDVTPRPDGSRPDDRSFPKKSEKIQARWISGRFQRLSDATLLMTMGAYLITPWLSWHGQPLIRFDLPGRQFDIVGFTFFPEDFFFLALLLMIAAFGLLLVTNILGRIFCGYFCPQTIWTRFFVRIERLFEGDRNARLKLDQAPLSAEKVLRRSGKHFFWVLLALLTAVTFVGYFSPIRDLVPRLFHAELGGWETWWIFFFTAATYTNAGWMREQICINLCPYGRFQSVMFDQDTVIVSYDIGRGEPRSRGTKRRESDSNPLGSPGSFGDCIDDLLCVQVCPTGIDIRQGLQYECIACAACIDACNHVMDSIGKPRGLIRYTTEHALAGTPTQIMRPRFIGYAVVLGVLTAMFLAGLALRVPATLDVIRDRNALFQETSEGLIENIYTLKIYNKAQVARTFRITLDAPAGIGYRGPQTVLLSAGGAETIPVTLVLMPAGGTPDYLTGTSATAAHNARSPHKNSDVYFIITATDDPDISQRTESRFIAVGR